MKNINIIIVNYNSSSHVINCLKSIRTHTQIIPIIVDNGSLDNPDRIQTEFPEAKMIKNKVNLGFSKAVNIALKYSSAEIIILLNPDTIVIDGFFDEIQKFLMTHRNAGVMGPKILDVDGKTQGSARRFPNVWTAFFGRRSPLTRFFPNNPISKREFLCFGDNSDKELEVDWVSGACMVLNRDAVTKIGGFDERFFLFWEDTDLCKRMKDSGYKVLYYPKAQIVHTVGQSRATRPFLSTVHFHYSCFKLVSKYAKGHIKIIVPAIFFALAFRCLLALSAQSLFFIPKSIIANNCRLALRTSIFNSLRKPLKWLGGFFI